MEAFHPGPLGQRLCVWREPDDRPPSALFVHVHAFAEEMNKSRRMVAMQARALAAEGHAVLCFDLLGCGDSAGDFGDASWDAWVEDVVAACAWSRSRIARRWPDAAAAPLWLWGLRAGCLLAVAAAQRMDTECHFLFWQPTPNGKSVLQQFLRLESAGLLLGKLRTADAPTARQLLDGGSPAQIAGYTLQPSLAEGLQAARLVAPAAPGLMRWIDVSPQPLDGPSPAAQPVLEVWTAAGWSVQHSVLAGPSFWQTTEIEDAPALVDASLDAIRSAWHTSKPASPARATASGLAPSADL